MRLLVILAALSFPLQANPGLTLWIDGAPVAALSGVEYDAGSGQVRVEAGGVVSCKPDAIHRDRFEAR